MVRVEFMGTAPALAKSSSAEGIICFSADCAALDRPMAAPRSEKQASASNMCTSRWALGRRALARTVPARPPPMMAMRVRWTLRFDILCFGMPYESLWFQGNEACYILREDEDIRTC